MSWTYLFVKILNKRRKTKLSEVGPFCTKRPKFGRKFVRPVNFFFGPFLYMRPNNRPVGNTDSSPYFYTFMESRNRFQGMNSARLCSLAARYDNPIPTRFRAPIYCLKIPALTDLACSKGKKNHLTLLSLKHSVYRLSEQCCGSASLCCACGPNLSF
jgi:hypothetical protein